MVRSWVITTTTASGWMSSGSAAHAISPSMAFSPPHLLPPSPPLSFLENVLAKRMKRKVKLKVVGVTNDDEGKTFWAVDEDGRIWFKGWDYLKFDKRWHRYSDGGEEGSESLHPLVGED